MLLPTHNPNIKMHIRPDQPTDPTVIREIFCENVYEVHDGDLDDTGVVIDLGANIGAFSLYAASLREEPAARVLAFEPQPDNFELLQKNILENKYAGKIEPFTFGVSDKAGKAHITNEGGGSRVGDEGDAIKLITLEDIWGLVPGIEFVDVLKIDVEGYEGRILLAASKATLNLIRYIVVEYDAHSKDSLGSIVEKLSETHQVKVVGSHESGGMIFARRY